MAEREAELKGERTDVPCPVCLRPMCTNGYTMYCENPACAFNFFKPGDAAGEEPKYPVRQVLPVEEAERIYREGYEDYQRGVQFHEGRYAKPGDTVNDSEYQRGYEWRRGWNDAALGKEPRP